MYENMLLIEDVNSVLAHHIHYNEIYTINTGLLPQSDFKEKYYDFCIIEMEEIETGTYQYKLEVYNRLWDGGISFKRIPSGADDPLVQTDTDIVNYNDEYYVVYITTTYTDFDILLTLNNDNDAPRKIFTSPMSYAESITDETYYYYETKQKTITLVGVKGNSISNADVTIKIDGTNYSSGKTNSNGQYTFDLPKNYVPGEYVVEISASRTGYDPLKTYFRCIILKETPVLSFTSKNAYKGGFSEDYVTVTLQGTPDIALNLRSKCVNNNYGSDLTQTMNKNNNKFTCTYRENLRKYRGDYIVINWSVNETAYTNPVEHTYSKPVPAKLITDWTNLKNECEDEYGVDYVEFPANTSIDVGATVNITRDMEMMGRVSSQGWSEFKDSSNLYLFRVEHPTMTIHLHVNNVKFTSNSNGVIYGGLNSNVVLDNAYFKENLKADNIGVCIYNPIDLTYQSDMLCSIQLSDCIFENNKGAAINSSGVTFIDDSYFIINDWDFAQHPQPFAVEVYAQSTEIHGSTFICDMGSTRSPLPVYQHSNFSWGKIPFYVQRNAWLNGKKGSMMLKDNSLSIDDNTGYIYAKYLYNGVNSVASPVRGYERRAFGHAISGKNWAWKDNIRVERESVYNNIRDKPVYNPPTGSFRE